MSSISDAISRKRPDLNKSTRFQRNGEPAPTPAQPGVLGPGALATADPGLLSAAAEPTLDELPRDETPRATRGPLMLTRNRILGSLLMAVCLGIGISFFPHLGRVRGHAIRPEVDLAEAGGAGLSAAANAAVDDAAARAKAEAARAASQPVAQVPPKIVMVAIRPKATPEPTPEVVPTPPPAAPMVVQMQLRPAARPAAVAAAQTERIPGATVDRLAADATARFASVDDTAAPGRLIAATPSGDEPADGPGVEEVLYEGMPAPEVTTARAGTTADKPSRGSSSRAESGSGIVLSGIFWDEDRPMAMINGEIVEVGQTIAGAKVVKIDPEAVTLEKSDGTKTLRL